MKKRSTNIFEATNSLKILCFLAANPEKEFFGSEIQKALGISRMGVYLALEILQRQKLVIKYVKGKFLSYSVDYSNSIVKQFKILNNIVSLEKLLQSLRSISKQIVLYGSVGRGEDRVDSDIDLFILTVDLEAVKKKIPGFCLKKRVQAVIKTPSEWIEFKDKEPVFYDEVSHGVVLWEAKE